MQREIKAHLVNDFQYPAKKIGGSFLTIKNQIDIATEQAKVKSKNNQQR